MLLNLGYKKEATMLRDEIYENVIRRTSADEEVDYANICDGLPRRLDSTPYHSGPHCLRNFRFVMTWLFAQTGSYQRVLEIGFCLGHSASMLIACGASHVMSVDNSDREQTAIAVKAVKKKFGEKFTFLQRDRFDVLWRDCELPEFDLLFIDGEHTYEAAQNDLQIAEDKNIPWVLMDDFLGPWGIDVDKAAYDMGYTPVAIFGSMALCRKL